MGWNYRVVSEKGGLRIKEVYYHSPSGAEPPPLGGYHGSDGLPAMWSGDASPGGETFEELVGDLRRMEEALHRPILEQWELEWATQAWKRARDKRQGVWWRRALNALGIGGKLRWWGVSWMR